MLIVFQRRPAASPFEAVRGKETPQQVALGNLVRELLVAVDIRFARGRLYEERTVCHSFYTGVVERVDVHRHPPCMLRELLRALHLPEVEAAGVVCPHGCLVVGIVFVNEHHPLDGWTLE